MIKSNHLLVPGTLAVLFAFSVFVSAAPAVPSDRVQALADAQAGRWEQAEPALATLAAAMPTDVEACALLARRRLQQQRSKEAVELLERAVAAQPDRAELQSQLGTALSQRIGEVSFVHQAMISGKMRAAFEKSLALDPNHVPGLVGLARYYTNAPAIAGGSLEKAEEYAREVEKRDAFGGAFEMGLIREHGEKWAEAAAYYRQAVALRTDQAWLHAMLGRMLARAGQREEARAAFETALKLQPDLATARDGLAALTPTASESVPSGS